MANILLVDPDAVAQRAMKGLIARGNHRLAIVDSVQEAWEIVRRSVKVDLILLELKLKGESGLALIQRLKSDCALKALPVVVYAGNVDRNAVRRVLELHVQNFLLKPYQDEAVGEEIAKATAKPWWRRAFATPNASLAPERYHALLERLRAAMEHTRRNAAQATPDSLLAPLGKLADYAAKVGAHAVHDSLRAVAAKAASGTWTDNESGLEPMEFAERLIAEFLNPDRRPDDFLSQNELDQETEAQAQAFWANAPSEERCPVIGFDQLKREMDNLSSCPIIDSIAASYQMSATGRPTSLSPLLDLVSKDPGLTAQILIEANRLKIKKDDVQTTAIEDPRTAIGLLGENRLAALSSSLISVEERLFDAPPHLSWPQFRMFQLGTAFMARFVCEYLEMPSLMAPAFTTGLLHDIGKLLLVQLHPWAFQAIHAYALHRGIKLQVAERYFIDTTTHEMAAYFAEKQGLPRRFVNAIRWMDKADEAVEDKDLIAVVSLARDLCRHNHVGFSGDTPTDDSIPLEETPEWAVLRHKVYLNFDLKKFETQAHRECLTLKRELLGLVSGKAAVA